MVCTETTASDPYQSLTPPPPPTYPLASSSYPFSLLSLFLPSTLLSIRLEGLSLPGAKYKYSIRQTALV